MKVEIYDNGVPSLMQARLEEFERQFTYPLGNNARFRISHCGDYDRFFRAMGDCAVVAVTRAHVVGILAVALRNILLPDGSTSRVAYFGDLKIAPDARGGLVLARLGRAAHEWINGRVNAAVGIAMDGTGLLPSGYTGRAGFPLFERASGVAVLRFPAARREDALRGDSQAVRDCFSRLVRGAYALPVENAPVRSVMRPVPLLHPDGFACGIVEDTRRGKRLFEDGGGEMLSAHLSAFAFQNRAAGARVVRAACAVAADHGLPALFVAVPMAKAAGLINEVADSGAQESSATVYATNLGSGDWYINTSEI